MAWWVESSCAIPPVAPEATEKPVGVQFASSPLQRTQELRSLQQMWIPSPRAETALRLEHSVK